MKRISLALGLCALGICLPAQANANVRTTLPAGNSGVNQYLETVPTDRGARPTNSLHGGGHGGHGGGGGGVGPGGSGGGGSASSGSGGSGSGGSGSGGSGSGGSGSGGSGSGGSGSAISQSTQHALDLQGADGRAAAVLALRTAPALPGRINTSGASGSTSGPGSAQNAVGGSSALGSLASAVTGSSSSGGLGVLLPVVLIVALFGTTCMAILRRRRHT
jgi:hypothetical protein